MKIELHGPGCPSCKETECRVMNALAKGGIDAEVGHVHDLKEIAYRNVMFTPAVAIDGEVKNSDKIPTEDQILAMLKP